MVDYSKMSSGEIRQRIVKLAGELPTTENDLEIVQAVNTLMLAKLQKKKD